MSNDLPMRPWGLGRMSERLPEGPPLYETTQLDPVTQITHFYDTRGTVVDMGKEGSSKAFVTVTMSRGGGGDGSAGSTQVADDFENDNTSD
ncbi:putative ATP-grasp-modified RiPP [Streptosporangium sp. NPDC004631]